MTDSPLPAPWLGQIRWYLTVYGRQLLIIQAVLGVGHLLLTIGGLFVIWRTYGLAAYFGLAVVGTFLAAWGWSASLAVLHRECGVAQALKAVDRHVIRLWAWFFVTGLLTSVQSLLVLADQERAVAYLFSPWPTVALVVGWYVSYATALLPMAVIVEGQGIKRALQLSHGGGWETVVRIAGIMAAVYVVNRITGLVFAGPTGLVVSLLLDIPILVATTVAYDVTYRMRIAAADPSTALPAAG